MSTPTAGSLLGTHYEVPEEERRSADTRRRETYPQLIARLSHQSVVKHFDAYADIPWDDPAFHIDPEDPRWELPADDVLGGTAWYRGQPQPVRARIGLHMMATFMKIGLQFEGVLKRGLLEFALKLPNGSPEFRYAYHEVIEEAQHSLMFQEFVNRSGFDIPGLAWWQRIGARQVMRFGRTFPELFFIFVLGGEDPIDHVQRMALRNGRELHPLLHRIMQIHVTEEARHLCFARHYLKEHVHELGPVRRFILSQRAPFILAIMAQMMMRPSGQIVRTYGIPRAVIREAYTRNPVHRARTLEALSKVRELCAELGLITPRTTRLWRWLGIWEVSPATA
jgi:P-aminobenzoate N-oxygenase AurF